MNSAYSHEQPRKGKGGGGGWTEKGRERRRTQGTTTSYVDLHKGQFGKRSEIPIKQFWLASGIVSPVGNIGTVYFSIRVIQVLVNVVTDIRF